MAKNLEVPGAPPPGPDRGLAFKSHCFGLPATAQTLNLNVYILVYAPRQHIFFYALSNRRCCLFQMPTNDWTKSRLFLPVHPGNRQSCLQEVSVMKYAHPVPAKLDAILCDQHVLVINELTSCIQLTLGRVFL